MNALEINKLSMGAGNFRVQQVSLAVVEGEYFVLMGMTGSGKSLLLKAVCGLARIDEGRIKIHGRDVTALEARHRNIGYVPQDGGLFPHLNVRKNIAFSLKLTGTNVKTTGGSVSDIVESLHIAPLLDRSIRNLSGGERQKVSLARALARKPELLVLDEPVCALDEPTRRDICRELRRVQKEFGVATLHVCHSRDEAELVSDRVGVMSAGKLIDEGLLEELATGSEHVAVQRLFNWS
jgi:ABC-type sugar transport system ATPase subunit